MNGKLFSAEFPAPDHTVQRWKPDRNEFSFPDRGSGSPPAGAAYPSCRRQRYILVTQKRPNVAHCAQLYTSSGCITQNARQVRGITQVAIMQMEFRVAGVRILINVIHAPVLNDDARRLPCLVTFFQQKLCQVRTVCHTGDESDF